ncbi:hypothetical protein [Saccharothrix hoggarensis]|uniref:SdrD B-like protein n=1 Tax=Saccharothrix hoggarensis TaxID=913853 RepID=A0ABW3QS86_9PSEU
MNLSARRAARRSLALVAAFALTATLSATAVAQDDPEAVETTGTTAVTTTEQAPVTTTEAAPVDAQPVESSSASSSSTSSSAPAAGEVRLDVSATVEPGPYLVGTPIPVEVTIANTGADDVPAVKAGQYTQSGSDFYVQSSEWGVLSTWRGAGVDLAAGDELVVTVHGVVQRWSGSVPMALFYVQVATGWVDSFLLSIPVQDPRAALDTFAGVVYGDRNANGAPDAGEGLAGVQVKLSDSGTELVAVTDGAGRFRLADVPAQVYRLEFGNVPDGWVMEGAYRDITVDGRGSASDVALRGDRPMTDRLSAAMRFTKDVYNVGDTAEIEVTLTNLGATDLTGITAGCDRSGGEGPELRDVNVGDLAWDGSGVTVPAGGSTTVKITGTISEEAAEYGAVGYGCDFGTGDGPEGRPSAHAFARVPGEPGDVRILFYHDRDGDRTRDADELIPDLAVGLEDAVTGVLVAKGRTDAEGRVAFPNMPAGPYEVHVYGPWQFEFDGPHVLFAGTCRNCQSESWMTLVPGPVVPDETVPPAAPGAPAAPPAAGSPAATNGGGLADTGAGVLGLIALGVLALAGGFGALLVSRRRSA